MKTSDKIIFGRKKKGISQEDFASLLNVDINIVKKWEDGTEEVADRYLLPISNILDLPLDFLKENNEQEFSSHENEEAASSLGESQGVNNDEIAKESVPHHMHLIPARLKTIKIWLIIGAILGPSIFVLVFFFIVGFYSFLFLLLCLVTIPLCVGTIKCLKTAECHYDLVFWGICLNAFCFFLCRISHA